MSKAKQLTTLYTGLTYDNVIRDVDRRELRTASVEKNWTNYVEIARGLLAVSEVSRMAVAEIAIRATMIRSGGDRQSVNFKNVSSKLTIKAFANNIGVKPATLWLWIKIKVRVFDPLPEKDRRKFKHDAAEKAFKLLGSKGALDAENSKRVYHAIANQTKSQKAASRAIKQIMSVRKVFFKFREDLSEKQVGAIRIALLEILKVIESEKDLRIAPSLKDETDKEEKISTRN